MFVYLVTNLVDGKMYAGKTEKTVQARWREHLKKAKLQGRHHEWYLYRAIRKHGAENFTVQCLAEAESSEELCQLERLWILALGTRAPHGYNMTSGGDGVRATPEVREKMRAKATGRPTSALQKRVTSRMFKGKPKPDAQRAKMAAAWDDARREEQGRVAGAVNRAENAKLRDYECPDCGTRFEQVVRSVYGGHRRWCLNYREQ